MNENVALPTEYIFLKPPAIFDICLKAVGCKNLKVLLIFPVLANTIDILAIPFSNRKGR